ncbi:transmembrane protein 151B [Caerostris extrusa]|uniref:Transmembrane protein 151B n=1 Tax=Caerostris extrusa TaxID=172846 RepID=A0AAV4P691_CAEEX|nr:transmembrane protein 151B [Caerostris extrusa]
MPSFDLINHCLHLGHCVVSNCPSESSHHQLSPFPGQQQTEDKSVRRRLRIHSIAFLVMLYLVYLVECWHCSTRIQLTYKVDPSYVYEYIERMREAHPIIWWKALSYHYIRRSRQVTRYRNGDPYTTSHQYLEKINTRVAASCFVYTHIGSRDVQKKKVDRFGKVSSDENTDQQSNCSAIKPIIQKPNKNLNELEPNLSYCFATLDDAEDYYDQRERFFRDNEPFDEHLELREGLIS